MKPNKALLIIDVQNDFCPGGALAVPAGDKVVPVLNRYIRTFSQNKLPVFASRDWHPEKTRHFKDFGGIWPKHCIKKTKGALFHPGLKLPKNTIMLFKGMDPRVDSYSVAQAKDKKGRGFFRLLDILRIDELFIGGLATDYCVKYSVLDALKKGIKVKLLVDAIKAVNIRPQDSQKAIEIMFSRGAKKINFRKLHLFLKD